MTGSVTYSSVEEQLALRGEVYTTTTGNSMRPLFRTHGCAVRLVAYTGEAKRDDVILWRDASGKYLLHRVVKVTPEGYITRGDNRIKNDPPILHEQVKAVLAGYYRGEKYVPVTARRYRLYVWTWGRPNWLRAICLRVRTGLKRLFGGHKKET